MFKSKEVSMPEETNEVRIEENERDSAQTASIEVEAKPDPDEEGIDSTERRKRIVHAGGRRARVFQRTMTPEIQTLDLIKETNGLLSKVLKVSGVSEDLYKLIFDVAKKKDRELVRLRRDLIRVRNGMAATKDNLLPRLVSKAQQAAYLSTSVKSMRKSLETRPRGKVAISNNGSDWPPRPMSSQEDSRS